MRRRSDSLKANLCQA